MLLCVRVRLLGMPLIMCVAQHGQLLPKQIASPIICFVLSQISRILSNKVREGNGIHYLQCFNQSLKSTDKYFSRSRFKMAEARFVEERFSSCAEKVWNLGAVNGFRVLLSL